MQKKKKKIKTLNLKKTYKIYRVKVNNNLKFNCGKI